MSRVVLSFSDRSEIATGTKAGWSVRRIARHLGRCPSVISREIRRNTTRTRGYQAVTADVAAQRHRARPQPRKVAADPVLKARVDADLAASWTPNQIAGRLPLEAADPTVERMANPPDAQGWTISSEAIYQYIDALPRGELARRGLPALETHPPPTPRPRPSPGLRSVSGLRPRPSAAPTPKGGGSPNTGKGDLIIRKNGASCAATLVERVSGFTGLLAPPSKYAEPTAKAVISYFNELPKMMRVSLAWDQHRDDPTRQDHPGHTGSRSTSPILTRPGSDPATRTPTASSAPASPKAPPSPTTSPTSPASPRRSTTTPTTDSATPPPPKPSPHPSTTNPRCIDDSTQPA
ncbi:transposase [Actinomyces oricola]